MYAPGNIDQMVMIPLSIPVPTTTTHCHKSVSNKRKPGDLENVLMFKFQNQCTSFMYVYICKRIYWVEGVFMIILRN